MKSRVIHRIRFSGLGTLLIRLRLWQGISPQYRLCKSNRIAVRMRARRGFPAQWCFNRTRKEYVFFSECSQYLQATNLDTSTALHRHHQTAQKVLYATISRRATCQQLGLFVSLTSVLSLGRSPSHRRTWISQKNMDCPWLASISDKRWWCSWTRYVKTMYETSIFTMARTSTDSTQRRLTSLIA